MNIEVANRLVELRKRNNLSQEALAEKLGISRQAVSKWERAEASPDTDNLILLARLYQISLDDLLMTGNALSGTDSGKENGDMQQKEEESVTQKESEPVAQRQSESALHRESEPMFQRQSESALHKESEPMFQRQSESALHRELEPVFQRQSESVAQREPESVIIIEEERPGFDYSAMRHFPLYIVVAMAYVILGAVWDIWHPSWLLFFIPPIWHSAMMALEKRDAKYFAYPVLVALLYLCLGLFASLWHPGWIIFLTIPLYYPMVKYFRKLYKMQNKELDDMLKGPKKR